MQTLTERTHRLAPPGGLFDDSVVRNLFRMPLKEQRNCWCTGP